MGLYLSKLKLFNWKNFHECEIKLTKRCFIIGANALGKSNLLDAVRFLRDIAKQGGGLQSAVEQRGGVTKIRCLAARQRTDIIIETELSDIDTEIPCWSYCLKIKNVGGGIMKNQAAVLEENVFDYIHQKKIVERTVNSEGEDSETLKYTFLEQTSANKDFRVLRDTFSEMEYLNIVPQLVRESSSVVLPLVKEDYYGRNFLNRLSILPERTRKSYLRKINDVLRKVVPQMDELSFVRDDMGVPHIEARYNHWRDKGAKQNEVAFSDGTLRLIGFLFAMLDGNGIILLEEPENNLNSGVVEQLPEFIATMQRNKKRQVLVTTHSYDILSSVGIGTAEVAVLETSPEGTKVSMLSEIPSLQAAVDAGFSIADAAIPAIKPSTANEMNTQF